MGFRSSRAERKARAKERFQRRRNLRQTKRYLLRQVLRMGLDLLFGGVVAVLWWPLNRWVAGFFIVGCLIPALGLLSIGYRWLRGTHQVQVQERAICSHCGGVTLPHQMSIHQLGQECEGAGWIIKSRRELTNERFAFDIPKPSSTSPSE